MLFKLQQTETHMVSRDPLFLFPFFLASQISRFFLRSLSTRSFQIPVSGAGKKNKKKIQGETGLVTFLEHCRFFFLLSLTEREVNTLQVPLAAAAEAEFTQEGMRSWIAAPPPPLTTSTPCAYFLSLRKICLRSFSLSSPISSFFSSSPRSIRLL